MLSGKCWGHAGIILLFWKNERITRVRLVRRISGAKPSSRPLPVTRGTVPKCRSSSAVSEEKRLQGSQPRVYSFDTVPSECLEKWPSILAIVINHKGFRAVKPVDATVRL